jgi:hypothetical protein
MEIMQDLTPDGVPQAQSISGEPLDSGDGY